ncbi:serine/threonine-protein kinase [Microbispora bryophytorum]|uniref:non-specific serine/threonine protein kinase n=1 Tax=Microbispora bryophytorum TaxID=1460882 RepID=A0A8H9H3Q3_9ACTN|nr:serine/threonine-protein kinase [Microbispora bryophytorum]MBD3134802.1 protein kinase [Microbispora bryophytorum]TQS08937.1 protein kinase [Microbispora bryophytorum]GGO12199.1 serine/threonine protein kinase [Microbispora bryophytorum]
MDEERRVAGRYHLLEPIGRGGMGVVWRAHDDLLDRTVAVKEVLYHPTSEEDSETFTRRTIREARAAGRIDHPNVVVVHDVIEEDGRPWIVMQLVQSRSLGEVLRDQGALPPGRVAAIGLQVLDALCTAHAAGVLHRDVKPENVLLSGETRVVLTDFGIATMPEETGLTMTGGITGTPAFIPPERLNGDPATPESDLWSLGATLYAAVEGRTPFERNSPVATMAAILHDDPAPPRRAGALTPVLEGLLRKDPARRIGAAEAAALLNAAVAATPNPLANRPDPGPWSGSPSGPPQPGQPGPWSQSPAGPPQPYGASQSYGGSHQAGGPQPYGGPPQSGGSASWPGATGHPGPTGPGGPAVPPGGHPRAYPAPGARPPGHGSAAKVTLFVLLPLLLVIVVAGGWYGYNSLAGGGTLAEDPVPARTDPTLGSDHTSGDTEPSASGEPSALPSEPTQQPAEDPTEKPTEEPSEEPSPKSPTPTAATVPKGWKTHHDPLGFAIALPSRWVPFHREATRVRFHDPGGRDYLQVDFTPWETTDPVAALRTVEATSTKKGYLRGYERIGLTARKYLGVPAADWEFTHTTDAGKVRVLDRAFRLDDGRCVALYWQVADSRWTSGLSYFNAFARTFQP